VFWIILYFFLLTIFFLHVVQFQMIKKFSNMLPTWLEEWIQRVLTILDIFSYKCGLLKCNSLGFHRDKKRIFVTSNTNILQSTKQEFFPHLFKPDYYKILWLYVSKNYFFQNLGTCIRNGNFGAFLVKT